MVNQAHEAYPGARVELVQRVPRFVQRALVVGGGHGTLTRLLKRRGVSEICILESCATQLSAAFPAGHFDMLVFTEPAADLEHIGDAVGKALPSLSPNGYAFFVMPDRAVTGTGSDPADMAQRLTGTGLGLYIVSGILKSYGAQYHLKSTVGKGTIFTIDFPLSNSQKI